MAFSEVVVELSGILKEADVGSSVNSQREIRSTAPLKK
jgi:hypothetical protein